MALKNKFLHGRQEISDIATVQKLISLPILQMFEILYIHLGGGCINVERIALLNNLHWNKNGRIYFNCFRS